MKKQAIALIVFVLLGSMSTPCNGLCRLKCSYEFIPGRFGPKIRYKDLVRLRKTKRV